jgi:hypothetical protein
MITSMRDNLYSPSTQLNPRLVALAHAVYKLARQFLRYSGFGSPSGHHSWYNYLLVWQVEIVAMLSHCVSRIRFQRAVSF